MALKRYTETARYFNANYHACAVVAAVNVDDTNVWGDVPLHEMPIFDWAVYMGGCPDDILEHEAVAFVAKHGCKLGVEDASHFFPHLPADLYRY